MPEIQRIARMICLRYATQPSQGRGWSVYRNTHWVNPVANVGTMLVRDDTNLPRSIALDRNDNYWYELATYDRIAYSRPPYTDKTGVQNAEIATSKWVNEETVSPGEQHKRLVDGESHVFVRPQFPDQRSAAGHTTSGLRNAQAFSMKAYNNGEQLTETAEVTQIPENGDITFTGSHVEAPRIQYELITVASEFQYVARSHDMVSKDTMGTRTERTMGEHGAQTAFASNLIFWLTRGRNLLLDRVSGTMLTGAVAGVAGPDGRTASGFQSAALIALQNPAVVGAYTQILWSTVLHGGYIQYGNTYGGWVLQYRQGVAGLPANMALPVGSYFDIRIINATLTAAQIGSYYTNIIRQAGRGFLPVF